MSDQICLKWNSFLNNIASSFESLWQEEGFVDVTLASDGQCLTAHKVILSASSPFFKKLFQKNPCQHPVIILQDVHFSELEALLFFIYKGEVNIEQKNLPALLKAAETLQIRGLSGADIFSKELFQKTDDVEQILNDSDLFHDELNPKKRHKSNKTSSVLEKALAPALSKNHAKTDFTSNSTTNATTTATTTTAMIVNEMCSESTIQNDVLSNSSYPTLEMKVEPFEVSVEDLQRHPMIEKNALQQLDTGQGNKFQGSENSPVEEITTLSNLSSLTGLPDVKPLLYSYQHLPYADLLPSPEIITTWASSRPIDHLACDLMKILFTPEERILCNVNGKMGKQQFDSNKIHLIQEVLLHFSGISPNSIEWEEAWKNCVTKIDTSNRGLKRYLFQRRSVYTQ